MFQSPYNEEVAIEKIANKFSNLKSFNPHITRKLQLVLSQWSIKQRKSFQSPYNEEVAMINAYNEVVNMFVSIPI